MFDSVLDRGVVPRRRLGAGAVLSVLGHAAVLSLALVARPTPRPVQEEAPLPTLVIPFIKPTPAPGPAAASSRAPARRSSSRPTGVRPLLVPAEIPKALELEEAPDEALDPQPVVGEEIGPPVGPPGDPGVGIAGGGGGGGTGSGGTCTGDACEIAPGMTRPVLLDAGREPAYTREALEARVQGQLLVQCVVTLEGRLEQCRAIRSVPHMERAVVEALMTRRYAPATFRGRPLAVRYLFSVTLQLPR